MNIQVERDARGIVTCWIDNPARRNALDDGMLAALAATLESAGGDPHTRAIFIRGRGATFCAGRDLGDLDANADDSEEALARRIAPALRLALAVRHCAVPTVAVVEGKAVGLGVALASWCDMTLAVDSATFSIPEARAGIAPSFTAVSLMQAIGRRNALGLCLTGHAASADEALTLGLVQRICPGDALEAAAAALAQSFIKGSPQALRECKALVEHAAGRSFGQAVALARDAAIASMRGQEAAEGMAAFRGRRPPSWATADGGAA